MLNHVISTLEYLIENGPVEKHRKKGLCFHVIQSYYGEEHFVAEWLVEKFREWPKFSGSVAYPVPHPLFTHPGTAYDSPEDKYGDDQYGQDRMDLARFLIDQARKELEGLC